MSAVIMNMQDFAAKSIREGRARGAFDDDDSRRIRDAAVFDAKGAEAVGIPMKDEANILASAVQIFERVANGALAFGTSDE
ncbi:hypothetical protein OY671_007418 [Metschnikowia pulcherrima]|nr:hypothetical protein OY671_007418 [Metschnikowia pulcherrima]